MSGGVLGRQTPRLPRPAECRKLLGAPAPGLLPSPGAAAEPWGWRGKGDLPVAGPES